MILFSQKQITVPAIRVVMVEPVLTDSTATSVNVLSDTRATTAERVSYWKLRYVFAFLLYDMLHKNRKM